MVMMLLMVMVMMFLIILVIEGSPSSFKVQSVHQAESKLIPKRVPDSLHETMESGPPGYKMIEQQMTSRGRASHYPTNAKPKDFLLAEGWK